MPGPYARTWKEGRGAMVAASPLRPCGGSQNSRTAPPLCPATAAELAACCRPAANIKAAYATCCSELQRLHPAPAHLAPPRPAQCREMDDKINAEKGEAAARPLTLASVEQYLQVRCRCRCPPRCCARPPRPGPSPHTTCGAWQRWQAQRLPQSPPAVGQEGSEVAPRLPLSGLAHGLPVP
jgi:hypothetical protein